MSTYLSPQDIDKACRVVYPLATMFEPLAMESTPSAELRNHSFQTNFHFLDLTFQSWLLISHHHNGSLNNSLLVTVFDKLAVESTPSVETIGFRLVPPCHPFKPSSASIHFTHKPLSCQRACQSIYPLVKVFDMLAMESTSPLTEPPFVPG